MHAHTDPCTQTRLGFRVQVHSLPCLCTPWPLGAPGARAMPRTGMAQQHSITHSLGSVRRPKGPHAGHSPTPSAPPRTCEADGVGLCPESHRDGNRSRERSCHSHGQEFLFPNSALLKGWRPKRARADKGMLSAGGCCSPEDTATVGTSVSSSGPGYATSNPTSC